MFTEFKGQSRPVIETSNDMLTFIEQASAIFCDTCDLLFDLGGVKLGRKMKERNIPRIHSVFYRWLLMARITNRKQLKHWAFIQSISNFTRGVGKSAECAFAYFGYTLAYYTHHRIMTCLMGTDKQGVHENNTLLHK